eukprot:TRINITY_DN22889_c3_g1_i1.p1 TRINITY_DN22889_c3_g1~~TRINITY_DN22889_c3_g1_i1.p1  ORF type:complete len:729 (+),score=95.90 TRINITY_DN22889_c3_g1_i1:311-2188(+)
MQVAHHVVELLQLLPQLSKPGEKDSSAVQQQTGGVKRPLPEAIPVPSTVGGSSMAPEGLLAPDSSEWREFVSLLPTDVEWGDCPPETLHSLRSSAEARKNFMQFCNHNSNKKYIKLSMEGKELRAMECEDTHVEAPKALSQIEELKEVTTGHIQEYLRAHHNNTVLPDLQKLYAWVSNVEASTARHFQFLSDLQSCQLDILEKQVARRTILFPGAPPFIQFNEIKQSLKYLCLQAGLEFEFHVQDTVNHLMNGEETLVIVTFINQEATRRAYNIVRSYNGKIKWHSRHGDSKMRVEECISTEERLDMVAFYSSLDALSNLTGSMYEGQKLSTNRSCLQIWEPDNASGELLAQICFLLCPTSPRLYDMHVYVHEKAYQSFASLIGQAYRDRMKAALRLVQAQKLAWSCGSTRAQATFHQYTDVSNVDDVTSFFLAKRYLRLHSMSAANMSLLGSDPFVLLKCTLGMHNEIMVSVMQYLDPSGYGRREISGGTEDIETGLEHRRRLPSRFAWEETPTKGAYKGKQPSGSGGSGRGKGNHVRVPPWRDNDYDDDYVVMEDDADWQEDREYDNGKGERQWSSPYWGDKGKGRVDRHPEPRKGRGGKDKGKFHSRKGGTKRTMVTTLEAC